MTANKLKIVLLSLLAFIPSVNWAQTILVRSTLPIHVHEPKRLIYIKLNVRNAIVPRTWEVKAPEGAPIRMVLFTGYNHHSCNMGSFLETAITSQGNTGVRYQFITPMTGVLLQNGHNSTWLGKCHEVPPREF